MDNSTQHCFSLLFPTESAGHEWSVGAVAQACRPVDFITTSSDAFESLLKALKHGLTTEIETHADEVMHENVQIALNGERSIVFFPADVWGQSFSLELSFHEEGSRGEEYQVTYHMKPSKGLEYVSHVCFLVSSLVNLYGQASRLFRFGARYEIDEQDYLICYGADALMYCAMMTRTFLSSWANEQYDFDYTRTHMEFAVERMGLIKPSQLNFS